MRGLNERVRENVDRNMEIQQKVDFLQIRASEAEEEGRELAFKHHTVQKENEKLEAEVDRLNGQLSLSQSNDTE